MGRRVLAVAFGVVVAGLCIRLVEAAGHGLVGDRSEPTPSTLLVVLAAWFVGAAVGTAVAAATDRMRSPVAPNVVAGILVALSILNMVAIPHPPWFWITGLLIYIPATLLGVRLARLRTGRETVRSGRQSDSKSSDGMRLGAKDMER